MKLVESIKRLSSQMQSAESNYIKVKHKLPNGSYSVDCINYTCKIIGSLYNSSYYLMVNDKELGTVLEIHKKIYPQNQHSVYHKNGILTLSGTSPIVHSQNRKIYFNKNLTKDKHFNYSLNYEMPSYENTQLIIQMKKYLQKSNYIEYLIDINNIDEDKLSLCDLNLDYLRSIRD